MSTELPNSQDNQPEDFEAAKKLVAESSVLRNDLYSKQVIENGGYTNEGKKIEDIGMFLAARETELSGKLNMAAERNPDDEDNAGVVHSDPTR